MCTSWWILQPFHWRLMEFRASLHNISPRTPSRSIVVSFLKNEINYRYKRGSSRSIASKSQKLKYIQSIFGCWMLEAIHQREYLINVDEASYSRSVKTEYSWLPRGRSNPIINSRYFGRACLIFALWVDGEWIWLLSNETTTAAKFVRFMFLLSKFIELVLWKDLKTSKILLDNAPLHSSRIVMNAVNLFRFSFYFLPPYSPCLAPVEWVFGMSKWVLSTGEWRSAITFSKNRGKIAIIETFNNLNRSSAIRIWLRQIEEIRKLIIGCLDSIMIEEAVTFPRNLEDRKDSLE